MKTLVQYCDELCQIIGNDAKTVFTCPSYAVIAYKAERSN